MLGMRPNRTPPGPGQESVWDYPRPPRLERTGKRIQVVCGGVTVADSTGAYRVLETSHPPVYYIPPGDVRLELLAPSARASSFCEWKGSARYYDVRAGGREEREAVWTYERPTGAFAPIRGYLAFYAGRMDACFVDGERVVPQPGGFYGGWVTPDVVGPFKGEPGTSYW